MDTQYFGTDGIRGPANGPVLNPVTIVRIAQAVGTVLARTSPHKTPTVVIGKDTRLSGYMIESALQTGFTSVGFSCWLVGPMPTPAISMLTRSMRADLGVMITASHNPFEDNGLKFFGPDGIKLGRETVLEIEHLMATPENIPLATAEHIGRAKRVDDEVGRYIEYVKTTLPRNFNLHGMRVVIDAAHGANYKVSPRMLWELGAEVVALGTSPNGTNINAGSGALAPEAMVNKVLETRADIGIALDGDADRLLLADETGTLMDGDFVLAAMGTYLKKQGKLPHNTVVGTVMSNMGLEEYLKTQGIPLHRTPVGDHYVEEAMREHGFALGGEPSGHIIFGEHTTTGDGLLAALQTLAYLREQNLPASHLRSLYTPWPMVIQNVKLPKGANAGKIMEDRNLQTAIQTSTKNLGTNGRVIVRKSGTEPLIRITVEAKSEPQLHAELKNLETALHNAL